MYGLTLVLVAGYPAAAMADTQEPTTPSSSPTTTQTTTAPTTTTSTTSDQTPSSSSPSSTTSPSTPPSTTTPPPTIIEPPATTQPTQDSITTSPPTADTTNSSATPAADSTAPSSTPANSTSTTTATTTVDANSNVNSGASSGNSTVSNNTAAGSATTGDAAATATLLNVVNSTLATGDNQKVATFTKDILGDVKGDIVLYPLLLKAMLEANAANTANTANAPDATTSTPATVNATTNFGVNNTVNVAATSGDATVSKNTSAGNATTGSAQAVANVVNILNSMIAAHNSFIGTINIYGNLEGDILIAPDFIPQLLANNGASTTSPSTTQVSTKDSTTIVNNISAVAKSGVASITGNTTAGNATTGDAMSNVVIFNVTGHDVVAKNSLLVFVNVLGKWVGMIVDAPANATAAMLGNDVTTNTTYAPDLTVNADTTHGITNAVTVTAQSGNATVANNTNAGNAVTGSARALANIANVSGSQFGLSDWFGVLFINVFQSWYGSFGIDTAYGNATTAQEPPTAPIQFVPNSSAGARAPRVSTPVTYTSYYSPAESPQPQDTTITLARAAKPASFQASSAPLHDIIAPEPYDFRLIIVVGSIFMIGLSAIGIRRLLNQ